MALARLRRYTLLLALLWTLSLVGSFGWLRHQERCNLLEIARAEARVAFEKDVLYRQWSASHGGIYVSVDADTPPNPYLAHLPERDVVTPSGRVLTLMNPAYMTRQVFELANKDKLTVRGHLTSLRPLRPENAPDPWERRALLAFAKGEKEFSEQVTTGGEPSMRLMRPFFMEQGCLKCHASQGYRLGDLRGGISVSVPLSAFAGYEGKLASGAALTHAALWLFGLGVLFAGHRTLAKDITRRLLAQQRLHEQALLLEQEIAERQRAEESLQRQALVLREEIKEREQAEEQLRHAQKLEAIGQLAGGIAHDFNNILTVIVGHGNLMEMSLKGDDPLRERLRPIMSAAEKAAQLTHSLLTFSRKQVMRSQLADLNDIVQGVNRLLVRVIGENIRLQTVLSETPLCVNADRGQLEQVLMNLITNGRDALFNGGEITVQTGLTSVAGSAGAGCPAPGVYALLTVTDTGVGMDEETRKRVFEPFFTTKEPGKGTGLGMAIVHGIITQHGGFVEVDSAPGRGTSFKVYLPLAERGEAAAAGAGAEAPLQGGKETVLLVEDEQSVRSLMASVLTQYGYQVLPASDGDEAVELFAAHRERIALVILDLVMPRKSGKEALDEMRRLAPGVAALFCSGYTADLLPNPGDPGSGVELIMKPIHPLMLLRKVREVLDA